MTPGEPVELDPYPSDCVTTSEELDVWNADAPSALRFSLHPNPTSGALNLTLERWEGVEVYVLDFSGRPFMGCPNILSEQSQIDLSSLANGAYFIRIQSAEGVGIQRVVVMQ